MEFAIDLQPIINFDGICISFVIINSDGIRNWFAINFQFRWNLHFIYNQLSILIVCLIDLESIKNSIGIDLELVIDSDWILNWFAINFQFRWNLQFICNHLSTLMEFVIYLQSFINSDRMCNWFAINYKFNRNWFRINYRFRLNF